MKNNTLTESEYQEFLAYLRDQKNEQVLEKLLDREARLRYLQEPQSSLVGLWTGKLIRAASILLLIGVTAGLIFFFLQASGEKVYTTSHGEIMELTLPDDSYVKLNANSKLRWERLEDGSRMVRLSGEAYFNVQHEEDNTPFLVTTENSTVKVLGTSFNVNSRADKDRIYLEEGMIQLERSGTSGGRQVVLKPGESAVVNSTIDEIEVAVNESLVDEVAWKDGHLRFSDVKLSTILERLEEIYGKEFRVRDSSVLEKEMEFTLPYANWEVTSQALALAVGLQLIEKDHYIELK